MGGADVACGGGRCEVCSPESFCEHGRRCVDRRSPPQLRALVLALALALALLWFGLSSACGL
eukprot:3019417-Rhodomonas_salina.2